MKGIEIKYTNEHIREQVKKNLMLFRFLMVNLVLSVLLILLSPFLTYMERKTQPQIPFDKLKSSVKRHFYVTVAEKPEQVTDTLYAAKIDGHLFLLELKKYELEQIEREDTVTFHGYLDYVEDMAEQAKIKKYFILRSHNDDIFYYFTPTTYSFFGDMMDRYPVSMVFGITGLIVWGIGISDFGSFYVFKHLRPACGSTRYSIEEIDEQANMEETVWLPGMKVFLAPKILIGIGLGVTAVEYCEIVRVRVKEVSRSSSSHRHSRRGSSGVSVYHTYRTTVTTRRGKRLTIADPRGLLLNDFKLLYDRIKEHNPDVIIHEAYKDK